ncbi:MAG: ABC transporter ATP-binding protein [Desulfobacterales bacterium]
MLEVARLDAGYGPARVLHDVRLAVRPGEMVFVVGRNGAGKTTLLKTIAGLLPPTAGEIRFEGRLVAGLPPERRARMGFRYVNQEKRVFSRLSVRSNIELAARGAGVSFESAWSRAVALYPKLDEFRELPAGRLSGGQREILLIGRALAGQPRLLLIDEPTEGLAAIVIEDILRILECMRQSVSAIIVEQNLTVVRRLADRIYVMKEGRIVHEIADPRQLAGSEQLECFL